MKNYLFDFRAMLAREVVLLEQANIPKVSKKLILQYKAYAEAQNHSLPRIMRVLSILRLASAIVKKPYLKVTRQDYERLFAQLREEGKTSGTRDTYKNVLKTFHKWLNNGEYPDCVAWFKLERSKYRNLPDDLLTAEDVKGLLSAAGSIRNRAIIAVLWESGARVTEVGTLQIKNVAFDDFGCQVLLNGKTGQRRIRLVSSAPYLLEWINQHPCNHDTQANLWVVQRGDAYTHVGYERIRAILARTAKKAKLTKPINPHHFRHSRATYMAQFLTEAQMKEYFGWVQDSDMAARYVHLSGKQVDDAILKMYGLKKKEEQKDALKRESCPRCKNLNDVQNQYCQTCWLPLTPQATSELTQVQQKDQDAMVTVMKLLELVKSDPTKIQELLTKE